MLSRFASLSFSAPRHRGQGQRSGAHLAAVHEPGQARIWGVLPSGESWSSSMLYIVLFWITYILLADEEVCRRHHPEGRRQHRYHSAHNCGLQCLVDGSMTLFGPDKNCNYILVLLRKSCGKNCNLITGFECVWKSIEGSDPRNCCISITNRLSKVC